MARRGRSALPVDIRAVRDRVEEWRRTRKKRSPMPEELWREAVVLAREHGIYGISRAVRVSYETLKNRVGKAQRAETRTKAAAGFVEVALPGAVPAPEVSGPVVELTDDDGAKLTIRLPAHGTVDVVALASAWWSRGG